MADQGKFLAIKNWTLYQRHMGRREWVRDYTEKDGDPDYAKLTCFQRYVLDGIQRLCGRTGKNPPNDATHISQALHVLGTDRPRVGHALATLIERGWLLPTNQQVNSIEEKREEEKREEKPVAAVEERRKPEELNQHFDGDEEFRKLYAVYPKPEDGHNTKRIFFDRVTGDAAEERIAEAEVLARMHRAAAECRRMHEAGELGFLYPLGAWLKNGVYKQNPEIWKDRRNGKKSLLSFE